MLRSRLKEIPLGRDSANEYSAIWNGRIRGNSKDFERTTVSAEAKITWSAIQLMLKRLTPSDPLVGFNYKLAESANSTTAAARDGSCISDRLAVVSGPFGGGLSD